MVEFDGAAGSAYFLDRDPDLDGARSGRIAIITGMIQRFQDIGIGLFRDDLLVEVLIK